MVVPIFIAKELKKAGFDLPTNYKYEGDGLEAPILGEYIDHNHTGTGYSCPEIMDVIPWLYKKYNTFISIELLGKNQWNAEAYIDGMMIGKYRVGSGETWKEAALLAIKNVLKNNE